MGKMLLLSRAVRFAALFIAACCLLPSGIAVAANTRVVHVSVALCDNVHQGIVPVPPKIGNGDDAANNLYWGAAYGVKSFMRKQSGWSMHTAAVPPETPILERVVFVNKALRAVVVADAYRGRAIREATVDFLHHAVGKKKETLAVNGETVIAGGGADLAVYIGHNGLMDFTLREYPHGEGGKRKAQFSPARARSILQKRFKPRTRIH